MQKENGLRVRVSTLVKPTKSFLKYRDIFYSIVTLDGAMLILHFLSGAILLQKKFLH